MSKQTILFIYGAWVTADCWEKFIPFFQEQGYNCIAPNWPLYGERNTDEIRSQPHAQLATLGIQEIVDHYTNLIGQMEQPPIIIGHSFGGLFTQILLDRGLAAAGVALNSAPPKGILPTPAAIRGSMEPLTTWRGWQKVLTMAEKNFRLFFANGIPENEQAAAYQRYIIPTPGRIFFQAATAPFHNTSAINFKNPKRAPLLLIAGGIDKTVPAALNRVNHRRYTRHTQAVTDYKEFPNQSHTIILEPGWEEVAAYIGQWLAQHI